MRVAYCCLLALLSTLSGCPGPQAPTLAEVTLQLRNNFAAADTDHSGSLSLTESRAQAQGMTQTQFGQLDTDHNGLLSADELGVSPAEGEGEGEGEAALPVYYTYNVLGTYPHDPEAFTQGLEIHNGTLYEGTGLNGQSTLRRVDLASGTVQQQAVLASTYFGEGITVWGDTIYQLTWRSRKAFAYNRTTFEQTGEFTYPTEGWGLTHDEDELIMSDGTNVLRFRNPETFAEIRQLAVVDRGNAVTRLNELEYINGEIWANVWQTDLVARINPATGVVTGWIDFSGLLTEAQRAHTDVLNGIAYDPTGSRILVTGKLWPSLFEVSVLPQ